MLDLLLAMNHMASKTCSWDPDMGLLNSDDRITGGACRYTQLIC